MRFLRSLNASCYLSIYLSKVFFFSISDHKFNIIIFDDEIFKWKNELVLNTDSNIEASQRWCSERLKPDGGTNIHKAVLTGLDVLLAGKLKN